MLAQALPGLADIPLSMQHMDGSDSFARLLYSTPFRPDLFDFPSLAGERHGARNGARPGAVLAHRAADQADRFRRIREGKMMPVLPMAKIDIGRAASARPRSDVTCFS